MFTGSIVALITPFDGQGRLDLDGVDRLVDFHLERGTSGIVVAGTTGESPTLTKSEFKQLLKHAVKRCDGRIPVLAGTGSASTAVTVRQTRRAADLGADGALVVTPYYNRPTQRGLLEHFTTVADAGTLPVVLYNVPSRTAIDLSPETTAELSAHDYIVGIKESVSDMSRIRELRARCGKDFLVLSGDDGSCCEAILNGADGVISVAANVAPAQLAQLFATASQGDSEAAQGQLKTLEKLFDILSVETNPIPVKWAAFEMGLAGSELRLPLTRLAAEHRADFRRSLVELGLLDGTLRQN